jgi:1-pyrroline-5-carboxylate dehydrogenase
MGNFRVPIPNNEPIYSYAPGTSDREKLEQALKKLKGMKIEVPMIIGGKEVKTTEKVDMTTPHDHGFVLVLSWDIIIKEAKKRWRMPSRRRWRLKRRGRRWIGPTGRQFS